MPRYFVIIPDKVKKDINKIEKKYQLRILAALVSLSDNPCIGKKLEGGLKGRWTYRVWPYRIIYRTEKEKLFIIIVHIGHRQGVYN